MPNSNTIKFVYDDKIVKVKNPDTNQTLLDFIRTNLNKRGCKSGCDEAACGACTVVIGNYISEKNDIEYKAINSCIFLTPNFIFEWLFLVLVWIISASPISTILVVSDGR